MLQPIVLKDLLEDIRACRACEAHLPLGANPVIRASSSARLLVVGQAPGTRVHDTGIPWNDPSGVRLREWMNISDQQFYDDSLVAIVPMGFCYPGRGKSGDLPPRPECAELWRDRIHQCLPDIQLTLLIGQYAQRYYLGKRFKSITQTVADWRNYMPDYLPLPHPSPRNNIWLRRNPWFEDVIEALRTQVARVIPGLESEQLS